MGGELIVKKNTKGNVPALELTNIVERTITHFHRHNYFITLANVVHNSGLLMTHIMSNRSGGF